MSGATYVDPGTHLYRPHLLHLVIIGQELQDAKGIRGGRVYIPKVIVSS